MRTKRKASKAPRHEPPQPPPSKPRPTTNGGDKEEAEGNKGSRSQWWRRERCIRCSEGGKGLLVCEERECAIAAHAGCLRGAASLDDSGRFFCPFCWYRRQFARVVQLQEEAEVAARNVHLFLEPPPPQPPKPDAKDVEEEEVEKGEKDEEEEEEEEAGEPSTKRRIVLVIGDKRIVLVIGDKRKRLHWTPAEEDMLNEGVHKFSTSANKNVPWRKVLKFGRHVFHPTRTLMDLKDKWRNIDAK